MPIHCPVTVTRIGAENFDRIDYRVMGCAYASQNKLGRLCDESAYEADIRARLMAEGFSSVLTQVPVTVSHRDFLKRYYLDLVADDALYELKAIAAYNGEHEAQLLNYIFLLGLGRGKLLNLRPPNVEGKLVVTSLTQTERRRLPIAAERWSELSPACALLRQTMLDLLEDWGAFLDLGLYQEALVHFLGGAGKVERRVSLHRDGLDLGGQRMFIHNPGVAFRVTAFSEGQKQLETHLRLLLELTDLKTIQWINLNHARIEFTTLAR